jgi:hypothetical protein
MRRKQLLIILLIAGLLSVTWGAAANSLRDSVGAPLSPKEQEDLDDRLETARELLSPDEQQAAWNAGLAMSLEEAINYALDHPS